MSTHKNERIQDESLLAIPTFPLTCPTTKTINLVILGSAYHKSRAKKFQCRVQIGESQK